MRSRSYEVYHYRLCQKRQSCRKAAAACGWITWITFSAALFWLVGAPRGLAAGEVSDGGTVLLDFSATWCGPCQQMVPTVERLIQAGYPVRKVDIDREPALAKRFGVRAVPTFVMVVNGRESKRIVGGASYEDLAALCALGRQSTNGSPTGVANQTPGLLANAIRGGAPSVPATPPFSTPPVSSSGTAPASFGTPGTGSVQSATAVSAPSHNTNTVSNGAPTVFCSTSDRPGIAPQLAVAREPAAIGSPAFGAGHSARPLRPLEENCRFAGGNEADLLAATVRIRVEDPRGRSSGSGTIIDARGGEALIATCGHLFRESRGQTPIKVDLFGPSPAQGLSAQLIYYDDRLDIGFLSIRPGRPVVVARVAAPGFPLSVGDAIFAVGCSDSKPPTVWSSRITAIDKYLGNGNIEAAGAPQVGRSGGGLFSSEGFLIGVCNAADPQLDEGIYLSLREIQASLDKLNLAFVYRSDMGQQLAAAGSASSALSPSSAEASRAAILPTATRNSGGPLTATASAGAASSSPPQVAMQAPPEPRALPTASLPGPATGTGSFPDAAASSFDRPPPESMTLAAGLPIPVPFGEARSRTETASLQRTSAVDTSRMPGDNRSLTLGKLADNPPGTTSGNDRMGAVGSQAGLSPEEQATWTEIQRRQAQGCAVVCVIESGESSPAATEVIRLRNVSPQFAALLEHSGVKTVSTHPGAVGVGLAAAAESETETAKEPSHDEGDLVPIAQSRQTVNGTSELARRTEGRGENSSGGTPPLPAAILTVPRQAVAAW